MCGIAGLVNKSGQPCSASTIHRMTDAVAHRGPDGDGVHLDGPVGLGHRRLSIIDLSNHAAQPMASESGAQIITYNGEVYNYKELRDELAALGHGFRTESDTEVVLVAYKQWGESCVEHFNGMWAFAILDEIDGSLFLARDRFGIKPFYFVETPSNFAFGSEIRQLLPFLARTTADVEGVRSFIVTGAIDLGDRTLFNGVKKLPAGHTARYDLSTHCLVMRRYYQLARRPEYADLDIAEATEQFLALFEDAVALRLRSDVKVATCLSGGLDSSSVATLAAARYEASGGGRFSAITAVSEDPATDETEYARLVSHKANLDWHQVRPTYDDFVDTLPAVVDAQEEPFGSPSLTMQYFVMMTARENGIAVMLDGQGGDETLLGYDKYYSAYVAEQFRRHGMGAALAALRAISANNARMRPAAMLKYLLGARMAAARYAIYRRKHRYLRDLPRTARHIGDFSQASSDPFSLQELEIRSTNLPVLLRYEDKNSMAHGVEARLPFLDYRLLEMAVSLPVPHKIRNGWTKWILRHAMQERLPAAITWRKSKLSFDAPENIWLSRHLPTMRAVVAASPLIDSLADSCKLDAAYPGLDLRSQWRLYSLALWEKRFGVVA